MRFSRTWMAASCIGLVFLGCSNGSGQSDSQSIDSPGEVRRWLQECGVQAVDRFEGQSLFIAIVPPAGVKFEILSVAGVVSTGVSSGVFGPAGTLIITVDDGAWRGARACTALELVDPEGLGVYSVVDEATSS